ESPPRRFLRLSRRRAWRAGSECGFGVSLLGGPEPVERAGAGEVTVSTFFCSAGFSTALSDGDFSDAFSAAVFSGCGLTGSGSGGNGCQVVAGSEPIGTKAKWQTVQLLPALTTYCPWHLGQNERHSADSASGGRTNSATSRPLLVMECSRALPSLLRHQP